MKSVFRRGITPEETLDAIAEVAYEEFQLKVPKEKIMITLEPHERHIAAAEAGIRKEIVATNGKNISEEIIQERLKRDETYLWRKGEIFERDVSGISGYEIRVFPLTKTMGNTAYALYYSIETIAHEIGHALQFEFERDIENENASASCMRKKYAEGKYSDSSRALMNILNNNEIKNYHLSIASRYSYQTRVKCIKEDIKNAEEKLKNTEAAEKKQRLETIIPQLYELEEAVSELDIIHKEELKKLNTGTEADKKRHDALESKAYSAIREGWAQYFSMVVMQKFIVKEISEYDFIFMGKTPEKTLSKARKNEEYLNSKTGTLLESFDDEMWWRPRQRNLYGKGFRRFMNLSKEEAKELALNYRYDMLKEIEIKEGSGK